MEKENNMVYNIPVIEVEDGELGFELPDELLEHLDLKTGDTIIWEETDIGWLLKKDDRS